MKKIIAAALSVLVGAFGYTIVDSTIENRVDSLESRVYMLQNEVSKYHPSHSAYTTSPNTESKTIISETPTYVPPTEPNNSIFIGKSLSKSSDSLSKFLIVINSGNAKYIPPNKYNEYLSSLTTTSNNPTFPTEYYDGTTNYSYVDYNNTTAYFAAREITSEVGDAREETTTGPLTYIPSGEYFVYLDNVSAVVTNIQNLIDYSYKYDNDYSLSAVPIDNSKFQVTISYSGHADPALAGVTIRFLPSFSFYRYVGYSSSVIKPDGTFKFDTTYTIPMSSVSYYTDFSFSISSVSIV